jgi:transcriptional regulator with XRE-family HTH domain
MNVELHKRFTANVRRRRLTLGLTQLQVAEELGISQPSYAAIETGRRNPGLDVVEKVAKALDCEAADLLVPVNSEKIPA